MQIIKGYSSKCAKWLSFTAFLLLVSTILSAPMSSLFSVVYSRLLIENPITSLPNRVIATIPSMASIPSVSPIFLVMFSVLLLFSWCEGFEFVVGGSKDPWKVPLHSPDSLNRWAESQRFKIGDALVFKYDNRTESVHVVNKEDYLACNTLGSHLVFQDGHSKFHLRDSGPIHFISGSQGHCQMGLKLVVVVMSPRHAGNGTVHSPPISLALPSPGPSALAPSINQAVPHTSDAVFISVVTGLGVSLAMIIFLS